MILFSFFVGLLLAGCGSSSNDASYGAGAFDLTSGVVVDPYISGAVVQEIDEEGRVLQSTTSNSRGAYQFDERLNVGSVLQLKQGSLGQHVGNPYTIELRRRVADGDTEPIVISPLTTLLSQGTTSAELQALLADAGLPDLGQGHLYNDPMAGLESLTEVTEAELGLLQAAMAVGCYLDIGGADTIDDQTLRDCLSAVRTLLNAETFAQVKTVLATDPDISTLTLEDFIHATATSLHALVAEVREGMLGPAQMATVARDQLPDLATVTKSQHQQRMAGSPGNGINGQLVFDNECSGCHQLDGGGTMDLSGKGDLVAGSHRSGGLSADEVTALAGYLDGTSAPPPTSPTPAPSDGQAIFSNQCGICHTTSGGSTMDLSGKGDLIAGSHRAGDLSADQITALANYLDSLMTTEMPPTTGPADGETLYSDNCAICHAVSDFDTSGSPDLAGDGQLAVDKLAAGHQGFNLTDEEITALANFLDQYQASTDNPSDSNCTACHGQPPNGTLSPNTAGAHAAHLALQENAVQCSTCHFQATHNGSVELAFPSAFDAQSGTATDNLDGTCSSIICHGGETTPDWWVGSIDVNTQCTSCHQDGTAQYNSYSSGEHAEHRNYSCTVCHNTDKMGNHFGNLSTPQFETDPAATIGGGATRVGQFDGSSCSSIECHGNESWLGD